MRDMTADALAAITAPRVNVTLLFEADFDSGQENLFTGYGTLSFNGRTYLGIGKLLQVDPAQETSSIAAEGATFQLSGVRAEDISIALAENYRGRPVRVLLGQFYDDGTLVADPIPLFSGTMDVMTLNGDPAAPVITMTAENELIILKRTRLRNRTHEDQQIDYPGDTFFSRVAAMQNATIVWK